MIIAPRLEAHNWTRRAWREPTNEPRDTVELGNSATVPCPLCDGAGACDPCYGSGFLWSGFLCPWCGGGGKCHRCGGAGTIPAPGFIIVLVYSPLAARGDRAWLR